MPYRPCTVSFLSQGRREEAKVDAQSTYEAACLALKQWSTVRHLKGPGRHDVLEIEALAPLRVQVKVGAVLAWLYENPGRTEEQRELKKRLRDLLADERR